MVQLPGKKKKNAEVSCGHLFLVFMSLLVCHYKPGKTGIGDINGFVLNFFVLGKGKTK